MRQSDTGQELTPELLLRAYAAGIFPMAETRNTEHVYWVAPKKRGILPIENFHVPRRLKRTIRNCQFKVTCNTVFDQVVALCAESTNLRPDTWINPAIENTAIELHRLGWAHSVEAWRDDELVGGLYGVAIGAFFAGESMFHSAPNASKVALVALVDAMKVTGGALIDIQWNTPHLESLGAVEIGREEYLELLGEAVDRPLAEVWARPMNFTLLDD